MSDDNEAKAADEVGELAQRHGVTIGTAESLTSGRIATRLGAVGQASEWFAGGVVTYLTATKRAALGVTAELVVSELAAQQMASACRSLLDCDVAVAVTGAGGPESQDAQPPGTVCIAVDDGERQQVVRRRFEGSPPEVLEKTTLVALQILADQLRDRDDTSSS